MRGTYVNDKRHGLFIKTDSSGNEVWRKHHVHGEIDEEYEPTEPASETAMSDVSAGADDAGAEMGGDDDEM